MRFRAILLLALFYAVFPDTGALASAQAQRQTFMVQGDHFVLDGKPFQVISGEMHYPRIPLACSIPYGEGDGAKHNYNICFLE